MAGATWRLRHQNIRSGRSRETKRNELADDVNRLLNEGEPSQSFKTVLWKLCQGQTDDGVLLSYLNALVKITLRLDGRFEEIGLTIEQIFGCLRMLLAHESTQIRSGSLRCIRHLLKNEDDVITLNKLLIPFLITRCLDLVFDSERVEAMKLLRKTLILSPKYFDISMARNLTAVANEGTEGKDRMLRICLASLSELGVLNSDIFINCGGVAAITRNLLECQTPQIAESLCGVLLLLLNKEETRKKARIDLHSVAAPFCDFHYKHGWKEKSNSSRRDERELRLNCSRLALLTILRSWPGILHFCSPHDRSGFRAIVDVLHLNQLEVRKAVLDLLYELLGLPQPEWTDELSVALSAIDPCEPQLSWRLNEGFIAAEGRSVLPHLAKTVPSTSDIHLTLLLYCFLENGLLNALTEVIATSDTFISVRATVLLGELLRLIHLFLPPECCNISPSLPTLLDYAARNKPQAIGAVTALQQLHKLMKKRPASNSLHLDFLLRSCSGKKPATIGLLDAKPPKSKHSLKTKIQQLVFKNAEDIVKDTGVLLSNDAFTWNWSLINIMLGDVYRHKIDVMDSSHRTFTKRLIEFFMPSKNKYSHMDLSMSKVSQTYTTTGIQLIEYLMELDIEEYNFLVLELFLDIRTNVLAITSGKSVHDCLFSPLHMVNTQCQSYFLFIGRLATIKAGLRMLIDIAMFENLQKLATSTTHDCYVKLIVSSLDYTSEGRARALLQSVLTCEKESSRLYATQFLLVLLRVGVPDFAEWGMSLLIKQLKDSSRCVYLSALSTLHEACEVPECLNSLISSNPNLEKLQEKGFLLSVRYLSTENAGELLQNEEYIKSVVQKWDGYLNYRYVRLAEGEISDALTLHQRNEDGRYDKRASSASSGGRKEVFLPPHLYGQLNQHETGMKLLMALGKVEDWMEILRQAKCETDDEILELKAALWTIGHLSSSNEGLKLLTAQNLLNQMIMLAETSSVYSVRATAFYSLSLTATTSPGCDELFQLGWIGTRHNRHDYWPIIKEEVDSSGFNDCHTLLSDDLMSLGNSCIYDFEEDVCDGFFPSVNSPEGRRARQLTLPAVNRNVPVTFHKRSYSESKTFDLSYEDSARNPGRWRRMRNSSVTESTTSGVSSCDSHLGCKPMSDQPLSTIPSSSTLSTIIFHIKSKSESSQRISTTSGTNSDTSVSSLAGSYSNKLGFQDLVGYKTMRYIRNFVRSGDDDRRDYNYYVKQNSGFLTPRNSAASTNADLSMLDSSFTTMFSVQKFPINTTISQDSDKCYMGICVPQYLPDIFPQEPRRPITETPIHFFSEDFKIVASKNIKHDMNKCFVCCTKKYDEEMQNNYFKGKKDIELELLRNIERLANPLWNKQVRMALLQARQREPDLFKNLCLYSQACVMLSENTYSSSTRRFIHELFFEVSFKNLLENPPNILECDGKKGVHKKPPEDLQVAGVS